MKSDVTTKRREWWGWFSCMVWLFFMMYGHDVFILEFDYGYGSQYPFLFIIIFTVSIIGFSFYYGKDPNGLAHIAFYTTPIAIIITAVFALLPFPLGQMLYTVSPAFMAPSLTRRVFGVIRTAGPGKQLTRYMSAITVCVIFYTAWMIIKPPKEIAFLIPAIFTIPTMIGIRRTITLPNESTAISAIKFSKPLLLILVVAFILFFWLNTMTSVIHTDIVATGFKTSKTLITALGLILPTIGFLLYGIISDKGYERVGLISGMMLFIAGILIALLPVDAQMPWLILLMFTNALGGSYVEFFILTIPIYFFVDAKRPVFTASLGVVANLLFSALLYRYSFWMPEPFLMLGVPVLFSAAISAIGCVVLVFFLFERHQEKTLATALYVLLHDNGNALEGQTDETTEIELAEKQSMAAVGLTKEEIEIALLLIEGKTRSEITRKLRLKAADLNNRMNSIRNKISGTGDPDPVITVVVKKYNLTRRETDMLRYLQSNMTNPQIAAELVISEATVKNHVRNLMNKLPVNSRQEIPSWLETIDVNIE